MFLSFSQKPHIDFEKEEKNSKVSTGLCKMFRKSSYTLLLGRNLVDHAYLFLLHDKDAGGSASVLCCVKATGKSSSLIGVFHVCLWPGGSF